MSAFEENQKNLGQSNCDRKDWSSEHSRRNSEIMLTCQRLINEKRHAIQTAHAGGLEKADDIGKDLLSILSTAFLPKYVVS